MVMNKLRIFGSSGLAREVADLAYRLGYREVFFVNLSAGTEAISGLPIIAERDLALEDKDCDYIIAIGDGTIREKISKRFPLLHYVNLVDPAATYSSAMKSSLLQTKGNILFAGARFTVNTQIGSFNLFNLNCTIAHDCIVEDFVTVSPGANVSGNVILQQGSYIGAGATILPGKFLEDKLIIGQYSIVGAGAVVTKNVGSYKIVKGIPAK